MSLGMNDTMLCPSPGRLKSHRAHGEICPICMPDEEWTARCPHCWRPAPVRGVVVQPHTFGAQRACPGAGSVVEVPLRADRPIWRSGMHRVGVLPALRPFAPVGGDAA